LLIDWLTLRHPLTPALGRELHARIQAAMGRLVKVTPAGEIEWEKASLDWDDLRSDSSGLFWSVTGDADGVRYITIGASPSSIVNAGVNVFGTLNLEEASGILIKHAGRALDAILPGWQRWQCRRLDVTMNYDMGSAAQVKEALRRLLGTDAPRRRTNSDRRGGDSVYWNPASDLQAGKAYHKGAHLRYQHRKGNIVVPEETLQLADSLLRLECKLGARWFRRLEEAGKDWHKITAERLIEIHQNFFSSLIGGNDVEVSDMGTLLQELEKHAPTKGRAMAAHNTWALIRTLGYTHVKATMNGNTFRHHCMWLRAAGLSSADLCAGVVLPFRKQQLVLAQPVTSWEEIRRAA